MQLPASGEYSPLHLFELFFSMQLMTMLIQNINKFLDRENKCYVLEAHDQSGIQVFHRHYHFHGPCERTYREKILGERCLLWPSCREERDRFLSILWFLHLTDPGNDDYNASRKAQGEPYDVLFKVRPLLDEIVLACHAYYVPWRILSLSSRKTLVMS